MYSLHSRHPELLIKYNLATMKKVQHIRYEQNTNTAANLRALIM